MSNHSHDIYATNAQVQSATIAFDGYLREALLNGGAQLHERMNYLLKPLCDLSGAFTAVVRLYDKALERQYIIARHCPGYEDLLDGVGARAVGSVITSMTQSPGMVLQVYPNIQEDDRFQADLKSLKAKYRIEANPVYQSRDQKYIEYLEQLGPTILVKFGRNEDDNYSGMLFIGKRMPHAWQEHEIKFILDRVPVIEMLLRTIKEEEYVRGVKTLQSSLDSESLDHLNIRSKILAAAKNMLNSDLVILRSYDEGKGELGLLAQYPEHFHLPVPKVIKTGFGPSGISAVHRLPCFVANADRDSIYKDIRATARSARDLETDETQHMYDLIFWTKSGIAVPLIISDADGRERLFGVLAIVSGTLNKFSPSDVFTLQAFAREATYLLQAAGSFEDMKHFFRFASHEVGRQLTGVRSVLGPFFDAVDQSDEAIPITSVKSVLATFDAWMSDHQEIEKRLAGFNTSLCMAPGNVNSAIMAALQSSRYSDGNGPFEQYILGRTTGKFAGTYRFLPDPNVPDMECDAFQLKCVFAELLKNAYEAHATRVDIFTGYDESNGSVNVHIEDNGLGITQQDVRKLFTLFFTEKIEGRGVGLASAKDIIQKHGGVLQLHQLPNESQLDKKPARFLVSLPVTKIGVRK